MNHSAACNTLCMTYEGERLTSYPDPASKGDPWSIGFGHTGPEVKKGLVWSHTTAVMILQSDLLTVDRLVGSCIIHATQGQFDALVSFCFNVGYTNFRTSALLRYHKLLEYTKAEHEFGRWIYGKRKGKHFVMNGLVKRRSAEAKLYGGHNG